MLVQCGQHSCHHIENLNTTCSAIHKCSSGCVQSALAVASTLMIYIVYKIQQFDLLIWQMLRKRNYVAFTHSYCCFAYRIVCVLYTSAEMMPTASTKHMKMAYCFDSSKCHVFFSRSWELTLALMHTKQSFWLEGNLLGFFVCASVVSDLCVSF